MTRLKLKVVSAKGKFFVVDRKGGVERVFLAKEDATLYAYKETMRAIYRDILDIQEKLETVVGYAVPMDDIL
jgi:hypothetical protein